MSSLADCWIFWLIFMMNPRETGKEVVGEENKVRAAQNSTISYPGTHRADLGLPRPKSNNAHVACLSAECEAMGLLIE